MLMEVKREQIKIKKNFISIQNHKANRKMDGEDTREEEHTKKII